jgi:hypothetical protein
MFLLDHVALLCDRFLADGRQVTHEMLRDLRQNIGQVEFDFAAFSKITHKEIARLAMLEVKEAIEAARL